MTGPACTRRLRLRPDVYAATEPDGTVSLHHATERGERLGRLTGQENALLRWLAGGWRTEAELSSLLSTAPGAELGSGLGPGLGSDLGSGLGSLAAAGALPDRLLVGGWLTVELGHGGRALVTTRPVAANRHPRPEAPVAPRLCRFAVLRREDDELVLESPVATAVVSVHDPGALAVVHAVATGTKLTEAGVGLPDAVVEELVAELRWHGLVEDAVEARDDLAARQWGPHELWFHRRSRGGGHDQPVGATLWAAGTFEPLPARRPPFTGPPGTPYLPPVVLPEPEPPGDPRPSAGPGTASGTGLDTAFDSTLDSVLGARRSIREHDPRHPITLGQLAGFLHRSARVAGVGMDGRHEVSRRPSPSGGALHGLEIYPVVTRVDGLPAGMYHYDPFEHMLEPVPAADAVLRQLVSRACAAAGGVPTPQVLLVLSCRFGRVMWKYQGLGYALVLKDVGALFQTMYLVATAMGLAPCALGSGDTTLFARATGLDPLAEASVGEFMLGSRPATVAAAGRAAGV